MWTDLWVTFMDRRGYNSFYITNIFHFSGFVGSFVYRAFTNYCAAWLNSMEHKFKWRGCRKELFLFPRIKILKKASCVYQRFVSPFKAMFLWLTPGKEHDWLKMSVEYHDVSGSKEMIWKMIGTCHKCRGARLNGFQLAKS